MKWNAELALIGLALICFAGLSPISAKYFGIPLWHPLADSHSVTPQKTPEIATSWQGVGGGTSGLGGGGWGAIIGGKGTGGSAGGQNGSPPLETAVVVPPCEVVVTPGNQKVVLNTSFQLEIAATEKSLPCHADVSISAPAFDVKPESQVFDLPDSNGLQSKSFPFVLVPKQAGNQIVMVYSQYGHDTLNYTVKPSQYVPAWMTPFLSPLLSVCGSMLTIPWWIERRDKRKEAAQRVGPKEEKASKKAQEEAKKKSISSSEPAWAIRPEHLTYPN